MKLRASGRLQASTSLEDGLSGSEVSIIAVGTPSNETGIDLSLVRQAAREIGSLPTPRSAIITSSWSRARSYRRRPIRWSAASLEGASGMVAGRDFGLAMNPEFLSEGVRSKTSPSLIAS